MTLPLAIEYFTKKLTKIGKKKYEIYELKQGNIVCYSQKFKPL